MAIDAVKTLERAKKFLEKNKLPEAAQEYQAILDAYPANQEVMQSLGDLYARMNEPQRASQYYGMLFDKFADTKDVNKAMALYARFLKPTPQPPDRMARYAVLLQKQNKPAEAMEVYGAAAEQYVAKGDQDGALGCWEKMAQLDPDNPQRHVKMGEVGEKLGKRDIAARGYLRAGQLAEAAGDIDGALRFFGRAQAQAPADRSVALMYAGGLLRKGDAARAVVLLEPFSTSEADPAFLETFGEAAMRHGQLDRARELFDQFYKGKSGTFDRLFDLASEFTRAGDAAKASEILARVKQQMVAQRNGDEFVSQLDRVATKNTGSLAASEICARFYNEMNKESKYFDILGRLFDLYMAAGNTKSACDTLDKLVDIDPYDFHSQDRLKLLQGKADPAYLRSVMSRMAKAASVGGTTAAPMTGDDPGTVTMDQARQQQSLDDLLVQAEIFIQYSLQPKALACLQRIAELYPNEEDRNERLRNLYNQASWWPPNSRYRGGVTPPAAAPGTGTIAPGMPMPGGSASGTMSGTMSAFSPETLSDLAKISEINRNVYRQATPKAVLSAAVTDIGKYLRVSRCLAVIGAAGQPPQMAAQYCTPGVEPAQGPQIMKLLGTLSQTATDSLGGIQLTSGVAPFLREMGLDAVLGVQMTDKETQTAAGMLLVGQAGAREWKPNESYFLQTIGDQMLISVNHTKLKSLVRNLAVADEKTGLLGRSSYQDCLVSETSRAKTQGTPLSLIILQLDRGAELLRQQGETVITRHTEQLAQALQSGVRQNDVSVKYSAWALAYILPDTKLENAKGLAEKMRKVSAGVKPGWDKASISYSASVAEAATRQDYDSEDIVTDLINRAEAGMEQARSRGGNVVIA